MNQSSKHRTWSVLGLVAAAAIGLHSSPARAQGDDGKTLYESKCGGCHSLDASRIGPLHRGVVGRKIASVPGFDYSDALKKQKGVWTPALLDRWLTDPQQVAPGSKMFFKVTDPAQRKTIIGYLIANSPPMAAAQPTPAKAKPKARAKS